MTNFAVYFIWCRGLLGDEGRVFGARHSIYRCQLCAQRETKSKGGTQALGVTPNFGIGSVLKAVRAMDDKAKATEIENDINACYANQPG